LVRPALFEEFRMVVLEASLADDLAATILVQKRWLK
jgi:hypothetical protein